MDSEEVDRIKVQLTAIKSELIPLKTTYEQAKQDFYAAAKAFIAHRDDYNKLDKTLAEATLLRTVKPKISGIPKKGEKPVDPEKILSEMSEDSKKALLLELGIVTIN